MTPPDSIEPMWRQLCEDLEEKYKRHAGFSYQLAAIGLPDVVWNFFTNTADATIPKLSRDELIGRALIIYTAAALASYEQEPSPKCKAPHLSSLNIVTALKHVKPLIYVAEGSYEKNEP